MCIILGGVLLGFGIAAIVSRDLWFLPIAAASVMIAASLTLLPHGNTQLHSPVHTQQADALNQPLTGRYVLGIDFLDFTNVFYTMFFAVACIHIWETLRRQSRALQLAAAGFFGVCVAFWVWLLYAVDGNGLPIILMKIFHPTVRASSHREKSTSSRSR